MATADQYWHVQEGCCGTGKHQTRHTPAGQKGTHSKDRAGFQYSSHQDQLSSQCLDVSPEFYPLISPILQTLTA